MKVSPVLAWVAVVHEVEGDWTALPDQKWFPYDYAQ